MDNIPGLKFRKIVRVVQSADSGKYFYFLENEQGGVPESQLILFDKNIHSDKMIWKKQHEKVKKPDRSKVSQVSQTTSETTTVNEKNDVSGQGAKLSSKNVDAISESSISP